MKEKLLAKGYVKRLHVNSRKIRERRPDAIIIETSKGPIRASTVQIHGPSTFMYRPDNPISSGARCWIETTALVTVDDLS